MIEAMMNERKPWGGLIASGLASGSLYLLLYLYCDEILAACSRTDGWYPALPVVTVLVFSIAHGAFTGYFWEVVGVTARRSG